MPAEKFYQPNEITECPSCGSSVRDPMYPKCWHCGDCGFAVCAYYKREIDEIRSRANAVVEKLQRTTAASCNGLRGAHWERRRTSMKCRRCGNKIKGLWHQWELCDNCGYRYHVGEQRSPDGDCQPNAQHTFPLVETRQERKK